MKSSSFQPTFQSWNWNSVSNRKNFISFLNYGSNQKKIRLIRFDLSRQIPILKVNYHAGNSPYVKGWTSIILEKWASSVLTSSPLSTDHTSSSFLIPAIANFWLADKTTGLDLFIVRETFLTPLGRMSVVHPSSFSKVSSSSSAVEEKQNSILNWGLLHLSNTNMYSCFLIYKLIITFFKRIFLGTYIINLLDVP